MAPPVVPSNFKFKYFFGVQIQTKNLILPIANLVSCNVLESNNTNDDAPPSSLMDSTTNQKVKTMEGKGV